MAEPWVIGVNQRSTRLPAHVYAVPDWYGAANAANPCSQRRCGVARGSPRWFGSLPFYSNQTPEGATEASPKTS